MSISSALSNANMAAWEGAIGLLIHTYISELCNKDHIPKEKGMLLFTVEAASRTRITKRNVRFELLTSRSRLFFCFGHFIFAVVPSSVE